MQKKLLLFGGSGFVGSNVAVRALLRGFKVVVATRQGIPPPSSPLEHLSKRVAMVGGRRAALEALQEGYVPGGAPPASVEPRDLNAGNELMELIEDSNNADALEFISIDANTRQQVFQFFHDNPDATSVISCIGYLTRDYHAARAANGDPNTNIAAGMSHPKLLPKVNKFVYVSAEPYNEYFPLLFNHKFTLKGYFHGKKQAEAAVVKNLGVRGLVLRPGFVYGTRYISLPSATNTVGTSLALPLWLAGKPLDFILSSLGARRLFAPPIDVEVVAETAVRACDWALLGNSGEGEDSGDSSSNSNNISGIADYYRMKEICARVDPALEQHKKKVKQAETEGEEEKRETGSSGSK